MSNKRTLTAGHVQNNLDDLSMGPYGPPSGDVGASQGLRVPWAFGPTLSHLFRPKRTAYCSFLQNWASANCRKYPAVSEN